VSAALSPIVSIVTPAHNTEAFIGETMRSAQAQSFADFEMIVVDDGSTDETPAIVEAAARADVRIRLIRQAKRGVSAARNNAIANARGEFFALLDSDDVWRPSYLDEQLALLHAHPEIDIVSANALNLGGDTDGLPWKTRAGAPYEVTLLDILREEDAVSIMSVFRRRVIERTHGFDESLGRCEDYDLWLRAARAGSRVMFNPMPLVLYRRRPGSNSSVHLNQVEGIVRVLSTFRESCLDRPEELRTIDRQLSRFASERALAEAKDALGRGQYREAARRFGELGQSADTRYARAIAGVGRRFPRLLSWAWAAKTGLRNHG
jgi:glycosyltransferase involved in cell wall biosynthesis